MSFPYWRLSVLGLVFVSRIFASPCSTASLSTYMGLGAVGCTINGVLVNDFNFVVMSTNLGSPLTSGAITVTPTFTASQYQLFFSATGETSSTGFMVGSGFFAKYEIDFNWDPLVTGAEDDMVANSPSGGGTATVTTKLCNGQAFGGGLCPSFASPTNMLKVFDDGVPADAIATAMTTLATPACLMGPPVCPTVVIGTTSLVDLESNTGLSEITGFKTSVLTPEPDTLLLLAAGSLALGFLRRRHPAL